MSLAALFFLYFFGLDRAGMMGPDEPRYASIGREMANSGDWVTPRLDGHPWFEKPALLYWMTAVGFKLGLGDDLAPRLPVAVLSVAFLVFYFVMLRREFGEAAAAFSTCILATSAGWLAYSHVGVTDLPVAACFSAAMLLLLGSAAIRRSAETSGSGLRFQVQTEPPASPFHRIQIAAGILLGLAVLAKGLGPLVLFLPAIWFLRKFPRTIAITLGTAFVVSSPWYILATLRNGPAFLQELIIQHHVERFLTGNDMHARPWWFFLPVILAGMFPWTPTLALLFRKPLYADLRVRFLLAWFAFGFVFFSVSAGKLPGYLLPLLPALAALCGIALTQASNPRWVLALSAALLWLIPAIQDLLPRALVAGLGNTPIQIPTLLLLPTAVLAVICWYFQREKSVSIVALFVILGVSRVVWETYPLLDRTYSARAFWRAQVDAGAANQLCLEQANRSWRYGLDYYAHRPIPDCKQGH